MKLSFLDTCNLGLKSPLFYFKLPHEGPLFQKFVIPLKRENLTGTACHPNLSDRVHRYLKGDQEELITTLCFTVSANFEPPSISILWPIRLMNLLCGDRAILQVFIGARV